MKTRLALLALTCLATSAHAGWTVKVLHPAGATNSRAYCTDGVTVGGEVDGRAAYWDVATGAVTYLTSPGVKGRVNAILGDRQAGVVGPDPSDYHPYIWQGSIGSGVGNSPIPGNKGENRAMSSTQIGGIFQKNSGFGGTGIWGYDGSGLQEFFQSEPFFGGAVNAMDETMQGGEVWKGGGTFAAIWSGTSGSFVSLDSSGLTKASTVRGLAKGVQVGAVENSAALWRGTSGSLEDWTPIWATGGAGLYGTTGDYHIGVAFDKNLKGSEALLWHGDKNNPLDLNQFVARDFGAAATAIKQHGETLYVSGFQVRTTDSVSQAVVWTYEPVPEPSALAALGLGCLLIRRRSRTTGVVDRNR